VRIPITCPLHSTISVNPNRTKFGIVAKSRDLKFVAYDLDDACTNYTQLMLSMQGCVGLQICNMSFDERWIYNKADCVS
jgi:hypothetical protein